MYSSLKRPESPSLETDKLDLSNIIAKIEASLAEKGMNLKTNAVYVSLQVRDMSTFAQLNQLYFKSFGLRPPVRVCV